MPGYQPIIETNLHIPAGKEFTRNKVLQHLVITGSINSGQVLNILGPSDLVWRAGVTLKIKNTTLGSSTNGFHFYGAINPGDGWNGQGQPILPGQENTHTVTAGEFIACMNAYNQDSGTQTFEITFL